MRSKNVPVSDGEPCPRPAKEVLSCSRPLAEPPPLQRLASPELGGLYPIDACSSPPTGKAVREDMSDHWGGRVGGLAGWTIVHAGQTRRSTSSWCFEWMPHPYTTDPAAVTDGMRWRKSRSKNSRVRRRTC